MTTLRDMLISAADGQPIVAVVLGRVGVGNAGCAPGDPENKMHEFDNYEGEHIPGYKDCPFGKILSWHNAQPWLNYDIERDPQAVIAWTAYRVIFIHEYDSMFGVRWVPTMPIECHPTYNGYRADND